MNARAIERRLLRNRTADLSTVTLTVHHRAFTAPPPNPGGPLGRMVDDGCWVYDLADGRRVATRVAVCQSDTPPDASVPAVALAFDDDAGRWRWWQGARWLLEDGRDPVRVADPGFSDLRRWVNLYRWVGTLDGHGEPGRRWLAEHARATEAADCAPDVAANRPAVALHYTVDVDDLEARKHVAAALARSGRQLRDLGQPARIT